MSNKPSRSLLADVDDEADASIDGRRPGSDANTSEPLALLRRCSWPTVPDVDDDDDDDAAGVAKALGRTGTPSVLRLHVPALVE
jgi:hypothetical protein